MDTLIPRSREYVGQNDVVEMLRRHFADVCANPVSRMVYVEAPGGIGKTFLLQKLPELMGSDSHAAIARIIDLSDVDARVGSAIESRIIDGLIANDRERQWYRLERDSVAQAFAPYRQFRERYERERGQVTQHERDAMAAESRRLFVENLNSLSAVRPIILRFDTAEAIVGEPPSVELEFIHNDFPSSAGLVAEWIAGEPVSATELNKNVTAPQSLPGVFAELRHVLIVVCGRPVGERRSVYDLCLPAIAAAAERCSLTPLSLADTQEYLIAEFEKSMPEAAARQDAGRLARSAYRLTDGYPLFLACYAQMLHNPDGLPAPGVVVDHRAAFEDYLATIVLNPLERYTPFSRQVLIYCLYVLSYARRGLLTKELDECMRQLAYPRPHESFSDTERAEYRRTINTLADIALVKVWPGTDLLYLHDEMHRIIDRSRLPDTLGMRDEVLDYLVDLARRQQQEAENLPSTRIDAATQVLLATSNRIYYELTRRPEIGYERYLLSMQQLLNQREYEHALVLRDELWRWLNVRGDSVSDYYPNRERFRASAGRELDDLAGDDAVWLVKYYLCRDTPRQARQIAALVRQNLQQQLASNQIFHVELNIAEGRALSRLGQDPRQALSLFDDVKQLLEHEAQRQPQLMERCNAYLGDAYTLSGYVQRTLREYDQATNDYIQARKYFAQMQQLDASADIAELRAQTSINLAYLDVQQGNFDRARRLMRQLTTPEAMEALSPYYQALALNVRSIVEMNLENRELALELVSRAWDITGRVRHQRLRGMISRQYGVALHELMKVSRKPDTQPDAYFADAERLFSNDSTNLIETFDEWSKYERTVAMLYREQNDAANANTWLDRAERHIDAAEALLTAREPNVIQAQLRQGKAFIYRIRSELETATQLLTEAAGILRSARMPRYAHIIAGSVTFERSQIAVRRAMQASNGATSNAQDRSTVRNELRYAASSYVDALTHCFIFADESRTSKIFERLINLDFDTIPDDGLLAIRDWLESGAPSLTDTGRNLVVDQPTPEHWDGARQRAVTFLRRVCTATIETRDHLL